jgi:arsenate reductase
MRNPRVLFICTHNSARSQMSEAYLRKFAGDRFIVESAGFEPTAVNPLAVEVMKEEGIDISRAKTQSVFALYKQGQLFDYAITVCHDSENLCPIFPGITQRLHWAFEDPASFTGTHEEKLERTRKVRDQIKEVLQEWLESLDHRLA